MYFLSRDVVKVDLILDRNRKALIEEEVQPYTMVHIDVPHMVRL